MPDALRLRERGHAA